MDFCEKKTVCISIKIVKLILNIKALYNRHLSVLCLSNFDVSLISLVPLP